ncbi:MAG TPA: hypothetical protein VK919_06380 [Solirubrobacterales bacterium]|nr:hypothetical protein [Solirubrobacterales bacterium]
MGIRDFLRRRRERESALPPGALEALSVEPGAAEARSPAEGGTDVASTDAAIRTTELPGADAAGFADMLRRAATTGLPQVSVERHEVDLRGTGLGNEIIEILSSLGIERGAEAPKLDAGEAERLNQQIRDALRREGIDPDTGIGGPA